MKWRVWIFLISWSSVLSSSYYPIPSQSRPTFYWTRQPHKGCNKRRNLEPWTPFLCLTFFGWCSLLPMFFPLRFCVHMFWFPLMLCFVVHGGSTSKKGEWITDKSYVLLVSIMLLFHLVHTFDLLLFTYVSSICCNRRLFCKKNTFFSSSWIKFHSYTFNKCCEPKLVCNLSGNKKFKQKCLNQIYTRSFYRHLILSSWWILGTICRPLLGHIFCSVLVHATFPLAFQPFSFSQIYRWYAENCVQKPSQVHFNLTKKSAQTVVAKVVFLPGTTPGLQFTVYVEA